MQQGIRIISFFGPPGSGKGTLAQRCKLELGAEVLSTGDLCRKHVAERTAFGELLNSYISVGSLVPDQVITDMVKEWILEQVNNHQIIILDGYPRTDAQAHYVGEFLQTALPKATFEVLFFDVSDEIVVARLSSRLVCSNKECQAIYSLLSNKPAHDGICDRCGGSLIRRKDDDPEVIKQRLDGYRRTKDALFGYYQTYAIPMRIVEVGNLNKDEVYTWFVDHCLESTDVREVQL
jgi:adenylate kinase